MSWKLQGKTILVPPNVLVKVCPVCLITKTNINSITIIYHSRAYILKAKTKKKIKLDSKLNSNCCLIFHHMSYLSF